MGEEEKGIELCKELASMYKNEMFDYEKLRPKQNIHVCVFPVSRPTLIFRATLNILLHF